MFFLTICRLVQEFDKSLIFSFLSAKTFSDSSVYEELNKHVTALTEKRQLGNLALLSRDIHILPDFHGNRSPIADLNMTGMVSPYFHFHFDRLHVLASNYDWFIAWKTSYFYPSS